MNHWHALLRHRHAAWIGMLLVGVALALLPFAVEAALSRTWVRIIDFALLYAMLALGLNVVVGFAGLLDLGYIAFYAVGAYSYALLASPHFGAHLPFWVLLPLGAHGGAQHIIRLNKSQTGITRDNLIPVRFVPLLPGQAQEL